MLGCREIIIYFQAAKLGNMDREEISYQDSDSAEAVNTAQAETGEPDEEAELREKDRLKELKKSKSSFMRNMHKTEGNGKKRKDREQQMKELINEAEKYASFLLSKHKLNSKG